MNERDTIDFATAFAVGAIIGVGATLLLRPEPPSRTERLLKELGPYRKQIDRGAQRVRKSVGKSAATAAHIGEQAWDESRARADDFRSELADVVADARDEFTKVLRAEIKQARKALRKGAKKRGLLG
jgi:gas vesicle protein